MEDLFEVLTNKSYIKEEEAKQVPLPDTTAALIELVPLEPEIEVEVPQEALTPVVDEIKQEEEVIKNKNFQRKIVNIFLPINFNICFGCSKEPSH